MLRWLLPVFLAVAACAGESSIPVHTDVGKV